MTTNNTDSPIEPIKDLVVDYICDHLDATDGEVDFSVYLVWFCYICGGWKALVSSSLHDGMYYEVTYNKDKDEVYLDAYKKFQKVTYRGEDVI